MSAFSCFTLVYISTTTLCSLVAHICVYCYKVCRRWSFLCCRPEIWVLKCNELGYKYGIDGLCKRVFDVADSTHTIDWQMAYRELYTALRRIANDVYTKLHPAVLASKAYCECLLLSFYCIVILSKEL